MSEHIKIEVTMGDSPHNEVMIYVNGKQYAIDDALLLSTNTSLPIQIHDELTNPIYIKPGEILRINAGSRNADCEPTDVSIVRNGVATFYNSSVFGGIKTYYPMYM